MFAFLYVYLREYRDQDNLHIIKKKDGLNYDPQKINQVPPYQQN